MGARLVGHGVAPDVILASAAKRASVTAEEIRRELKMPADRVRCSEEVYAAPTSRLLAVLAELEEGINSVALVGHNPGITDLANLLLASGDGYIENVPTCGMVCMDLDIPAWRRIAANAGRLVFFDYPKLTDHTREAR